MSGLSSLLPIISSGSSQQSSGNAQAEREDPPTNQSSSSSGQGSGSASSTQQSAAPAKPKSDTGSAKSDSASTQAQAQSTRPQQSRQAEEAQARSLVQSLASGQGVTRAGNFSASQVLGLVDLVKPTAASSGSAPQSVLSVVYGAQDPNRQEAENKPSNEVRLVENSARFAQATSRSEPEVDKRV